MKIDFNNELRIVRAEKIGLVGYADGEAKPTHAWGSDREFAAWVNRGQPVEIEEPTTADAQALARKLRPDPDTVVVDLPTTPARKGWLK